MPTLMIQGTEIPYDEKDVITFHEGLIGLPELKRMVMIRQDAIEPLHWLVSLSEARTAFVVGNLKTLFPGFRPTLPADSNFDWVYNDETLILATVLVSPQWQESTINLRAPLFVCPHTMQGAQIALADNSYQLCTPLPLATAA